jgi:mono/diheme cytochrome c family protein
MRPPMLVSRRIQWASIPISAQDPRNQGPIRSRHSVPLIGEVGNAAANGQPGLRQIAVPASYAGSTEHRRRNEYMALCSAVPFRLGVVAILAPWALLATLLLAARPAASLGQPKAAAGPSARSARPPHATPEVPSAEQLAQARNFFRQHCQRCHGADGMGTRTRSTREPTPNFTNHAWQAQRTDLRLLVAILDGSGTQMPAFAGRVDAGQARALVAHVRTFDAVRGAQSADPPSDFDKRLDELQQEWQELRKQFWELSPSSQGAGSMTEGKRRPKVSSYGGPGQGWQDPGAAVFSQSA